MKSTLPPSPHRAHHRAVARAPFRLAWTAVLCTAALAGCNKPSSDVVPANAPPGSAQAQFNAIVDACTQSVAARTDSVVDNGGGKWVKTGFSAALVQGEVNSTESTVTPFVGKIVVKDNHAQATASTEAEVRAIILSPMYLLANRTHTFIYQFDGTKWRWNNASLVSKSTTQPEATKAVTRDEMIAPDSGFFGCLPG